MERRTWWRRAAVAAALLVCLSPLGASAQQGGEDARSRAAASLYELASKDFAEGRFQASLEKLLEVYKLDPNPILLYNIGRAYEELGDLAEAADYFQRAVADAALPTELQAEVGKRLPRVVPALKLREARGLSANTLRLSVKQAQEGALSAFRERQKNNDPVVIAPPPRVEPAPLGGLFWGGVGALAVGAGLLGGGAVVDLGLSGPIDELKDPGTRQDAARTRALQAEIEDDQALAGLLYLSGGVVLVAGGALTALSLLEVGPEAPAAGEGAWWLAPVLGPAQVGLGVQGSFP